MKLCFQLCNSTTGTWPYWRDSKVNWGVFHSAPSLKQSWPLASGVYSGREQILVVTLWSKPTVGALGCTNHWCECVQETHRSVLVCVLVRPTHQSSREVSGRSHFPSFFFTQFSLTTSLTHLWLKHCLTMMVLIPVSCTMSRTSIHSSLGTLSIRSSPLNLFLTSAV